MATDTVMQNDPNDAFAKMTDEEIVLESQQHDNVLAQEYLLHKYRNFVRAKARSYFFNRCRARRYYSGRHDRSL